jgi:peptidoglycan/LPS O-acetylase OafA/YrhL
MKASSDSRTRLHYLDWLRVLALFGVFIFHTIRPFDFIDFHINNAELSLSATYFIVFFYPLGMPLFFMISGASTFFALKRRSIREYSIERVQRLFIPLIIGSIVLTPIQAYYEMLYKGLYVGTFLNFLGDGTILEFIFTRVRAIGLNPKIFGALGYHLWFLGFLFLFSLMAIPIYRWLNGENGSCFIERLVKLVNNPVGIFLWVIPLTLTQIVINPSFPDQQDWADFLYHFLFFVYGYVLFSDQRFLKALKKKWWLILILSFTSSVLILSTVSTNFIDPVSTPLSMIDLLIKWGVFSINSWFWTILLLLIGMRYLDFTNNWLKYGKEAILPFFLIHHPIIIVIAFYVVQWNTNISLKLLSILGCSLIITLGIFELVIKRIHILGDLLGVKHNTK